MKRICVLFAFLCALLAGSALAEYEIEVDASNQIVTVYRGAGRGTEDIARQMACSTGRSNSTPKGTFTIFTRKGVDRQEWYYIRAYRAYVQYPTRFYNDYLFHSLPYTQPDTAMIDESALAQMGFPASHGCVRLYSEDAKWISENCPDGTKVRVYTTGESRNDLRVCLIDQTYVPGEPWLDYDEYMGWSDDPDAVSRASSPDAVRALQTLLREWGYYAPEPDGVFSVSTRRAVMEAQAAIGLRANGLADAELMRAFEKGFVPASTRVPLEVGDEGPAVAALQSALDTLGYYTGEVDGAYSPELGECVRIYRAVRGLGEGANADEALQRRAREDQRSFYQPEGSRLVITRTDAKIARFTRSDITLAMRSWHTEGSSFIRYVHPDDVVWVLESPEWGWVRVRVEEDEGYVKSSFLKITDTVVYGETYVLPE